MDADYIVIGAGSAGCVVASRLSEDGSKVVLLEAGPPDHHPLQLAPLAFVKVATGSIGTWQYQSEPEPHLAAPHVPRRGREAPGAEAEIAVSG